jgi:hypothetical protein
MPVEGADRICAGGVVVDIDVADDIVAPGIAVRGGNGAAKQQRERPGCDSQVCRNVHG